MIMRIPEVYIYDKGILENIRSELFWLAFWPTEFSCLIFLENEIGILCNNSPIPKKKFKVIYFFLKEKLLCIYISRWLRIYFCFVFFWIWSEFHSEKQLDSHHYDFIVRNSDFIKFSAAICTSDKVPNRKLVTNKNVATYLPLLFQFN